MHRVSTSINIEGGLFLPVETPNLGVSTKHIKHLIINKKTKKGETVLRVRRPPRKPKGSEACKETFRAPQHAKADHRAAGAPERDRQGSPRCEGKQAWINYEF